MNLWRDENDGSKIFWFVETKGGNQKLVHPDGTYRLMRKKHKHFEKMGKQSLAGWQRAKLMMEEYGIWDATAFGCTMNTLIGIRTKKWGHDLGVYIFSTPQNAERAVYPYLDEEKVALCRKYVDDFYQNPNIQAAWNDFILHPVCLKVMEDTKEFVPVAIESIGCGQGVFGEYKMRPIVSLKEKDEIDEMFVEYEMMF